MDLYLVIFFLFAAALGTLISGLAGKRFHKQAEELEEQKMTEKTPLDVYRESGDAREFSTEEMILPEEDFFDREHTELDTLEEEMKDLSEEEQEAILKEISEQDTDS